jgi:hypothetical protein
MAEEYELGTVGPIPTINPRVAKIGDMLKYAKKYADQYYVKDYVPLIGGMTLGDFLLGQAPEEVERIGQGNYPFRNPATVVGTGGNRLDVFKAGRFEPLLDVALNVALPGAGAAQMTAKPLARTLGPKAYEKLEDYLIKTGGIQQIMQGPESKTWNKEMAFNARKLEAKGETPEQIYEKTGMARGLDNQWRQEISDKFATMKGSGTYGETVMNRMSALGKDKTAEPVTLNDIFYHPKLSEAYPELMNTEVQFTKKGSQNKGELVHTNEGYIVRVNPDMPAEKAKSTILHEIQHAVQGQEGWNRGANYGEQVKYYFDEQKKIMSQIEDLNRQGSEAYKAGDIDKYRELMQSRDVLSRKYGQIEPEKMGYEDYLLHGGEAESRLVQNRMNLGDEELRQYYPYQNAPKQYGLDINPDEAIISTQHPRSINTPMAEFEYRGAHTAPYKTEDATTAPGYELNRTFPDDVYGPNGYRYYGHGGDAENMDKETMAIMQQAKGNPDYPITVYRAVPKEFVDEDIYTGDWITPNINYAKEHGRRFDNGYHIIEKTVPAKYIWNDGNSIHEFGYDPSD